MPSDRSVRQRRLRRAGSRGCVLRVERVEPRQLLATLTVSSLADSGSGTLRQAILDSNATPGQNLIRFSIPGPGPFSIAPTTDLPTITNTVTIDGTSQPGYAGNPIIELNGSQDTGPGSTGNGLTINAPGCTVRGLVLLCH